jgi:hypothetical protein
MTALMAGLFYAWSCSVMLGFSSLSDRKIIDVLIGSYQFNKFSEP